MPEEEKPYRLYKGGRVKGKVPAPSRPERRKDGRTNGRDRRSSYRGPRTPRPGRKRRWARWIALALGVVVLLFVIWAVAGFLSFQSGIGGASKRVPRAVKA